MRFWNPGRLVKKVEVWADSSVKILRYDVDNAYPQRMYQHYLRSGYTKLCVSLYARFIFGGGLADKTLYKTVINDKKQKLDQLLRKTILDFAIFKGFALHFNYNALGQIHSIQRIPFDYCRVGMPDDTEYISKIVVWNNWDRSFRKTANSRKPDYIDVFNPDPAVVLAQMETAGGIEQYLGQVFYYNGDTDDYPYCSFDSVIEDTRSDAGISDFKLSSIENGFLNAYIVQYPAAIETDRERDELDTTLKTLQGPRKAGSFAVIENPLSDKQPLLFNKVDIQNTDRLFEWTETSTQTKIRKNFLIPPVLVGEFVGGQLSSQQIADSYDFYNAVTQDERLIFEELLTEIFKYWRQPVSTTDYTIIPLQYTHQATTETTSTTAAPQTDG
jgi:hypothetical protein